MSKLKVYVDTEVEIEINVQDQAKILEDAVVARIEEVKEKLVQKAMDSIETIALRNIERRVESILGKTVVDYVQKHINEELNKRFKE